MTRVLSKRRDAFLDSIDEPSSSQATGHVHASHRAATVSTLRAAHYRFSSHYISIATFENRKQRRMIESIGWLYE